MDFLINRTNILDALTNENPKVMEDLGDLGRFLVNLIRPCGIDPADTYITQLNNEIMFDEVFGKVIGTSNNFLMKCLTGEQGRGQHMCKENELIFAHITYDDFPEAYQGVENEFMVDFGNILISNGFKEITDDLKSIRHELDFEIKNTRSYIYTVNKLGREFAPMFDQIIQYNMDLDAEAERRAEEEMDMDPDHGTDIPDVGYKYYVTFSYTRKHSSKGTQIGNQIICIDYPINSIDAIDALAKYIEGTLEEMVAGSLMIIAFSYMGIQRFEMPEQTEEDQTEGIYGEPPAEYFLDEEDGDTPAVEPVITNQQNGRKMLSYLVHYTSSGDDYKKHHSIRIASYIDLQDASDAQLAEVVKSYLEDMSGVTVDYDISISGIEEVPITPGEIPTQLEPEPEEYEIEVHED